jgi:predicted nucleotidyltransferase
MSLQGVLNVVDTLTQTGIIQTVGTGRATLYEVNSYHPFADVLAPMFLLEHTRVQKILGTIREILAGVDPALAAGWAYGSVARSEDTVESDFDITVVVRDDTRVEDVTQKVREKLHELGESQIIGFSVIGLSMDDVARLGRAKDPFWVGLERDATVLYGLRPNEALREASAATRKRKQTK